MDNSVKSFKHAYKGHHNFKSECQVDLFQENGKTIVVFTDLGIGTSVTNLSEVLATQMVSLLGLNPLETLWAEKYHAVKGGRGETLDQITYTWTGQKYINPEWRRVDSITAIAQNAQISPLGWYGNQPDVLYIAETNHPKKYLVRGASEEKWESMWLDIIKIGVGTLSFTPNPTVDRLRVEQYLNAMDKTKTGREFIDIKNTNPDPDANGLLLKDSSAFIDAYFDDVSEQSHQRYVEKTQKAFQSRMKI